MVAELRFGWELAVEFSLVTEAVVDALLREEYVEALEHSVLHLSHRHWRPVDTGSVSSMMMVMVVQAVAVLAVARVEREYSEINRRKNHFQK